MVSYTSDKPVLYVFGGAVWPSAPWLAVYALGLQDQIEVKQINLIEGANFDPSFVSINPTAQLPLLVFPDGKTISTTKNVTLHLIGLASPDVVGKASGTDFVEKLHEDAIDPNFALLSSRNEEERSAKTANIPGLFVANRQAALEKFAQTAPAELATFYKEKTAANGFLNTVYHGSADSEDVKQAREKFFALSNLNHDAVSQFIQKDIVAALPESGYIGGAHPGEDDFHLAGYLARIGLLAGSDTSPEGGASLKNYLGTDATPAKVAAYWALWANTPAWKEVYSQGLH